MKAASWGGIVRAQPSMDAARVVSLKEGEAVTLLEDTGIEMNGFNWFRIRFRGRTEGYQWGGILCGRGAPVAGIFEVCK